jgi:hypothetical protein
MSFYKYWQVPKLVSKADDMKLLSDNHNEKEVQSLINKIKNTINTSNQEDNIINQESKKGNYSLGMTYNSYKCENLQKAAILLKKEKYEGFDYNYSKDCTVRISWN